MLCPNKGGAVRKVTMNITGIKSNYNDFDIFWAHNYCGKKLNLRCTKKVFINFLKNFIFKYRNSKDCSLKCLT